MKTMLMTKMKLAAALVLAVGLLGFGASVVVQHAVQGAQPLPGDRPNDAGKLPPGIGVGAAQPGNFKADQPAAEKPQAVRGQAADVSYSEQPLLRVPGIPPPPVDGAVPDRLAKIEERLVKLEAQVAKLQAKPGTKTDNTFGNSSTWTLPDGDAKLPAEEKLWTIDTHQFKLPIAIDEKQQAAIAEVDLYMSVDQGKTWKVAARLAGDQRDFPVNVPHNGVYWFKLHVIYKDRPAPKPDIEAWKPDLKVHVAAKSDNTDTLLHHLETQLKELQERIAELKGKKGDKLQP
jgi:hypothetical protein